MATLLRPAGKLAPYEVHFTSGGKSGNRILWAPSQRTAEQLLRDNPGCFGLNEHVTIRRTLRLHIREQRTLWPDERSRAA